MSTTIGCQIPGASQPKEPMRLIDVAPILKNIELDIIMLHGKADELGKSAYAIRCTKDIVKLRDFAKWMNQFRPLTPNPCGLRRIGKESKMWLICALTASHVLRLYRIITNIARNVVQRC